MNLYTYVEEELFMAPKPLSGFIIIYVITGTVSSSRVFDTMSIAESHTTPNTVGIIDLSQHNEGEGIEQ